MRFRAPRRAAAAVALAAAFASCGKPTPPPEPQRTGARLVKATTSSTARAAVPGRVQTPEPAPAEAVGLARLTGGDDSATRLKPVSYETLQPFLPQLPGWTQSETRGEQLSAPVVYSRVETHYRKDDARIELEITDTAMNELLLAPVSMFVGTGFSERTPDGFRTASAIAGQPGAEEWRARPRRGDVLSIVARRFVVHAVGYGVADLAPVREAVRHVSAAGLTALR